MSLSKVFDNFDQPIQGIRKGNEILNSVVKPILSKTSKFDRISSFFSPDAIKLIFAELLNCISAGGRIRLIIGIHDCDKLINFLKLQNESSKTDNLRKAISLILQGEIVDVLNSIDNPEYFKTIFSELLNQELIKVKIAAVKKDFDSYEKYGVWPKNDSTFHPKISIFKNSDDSEVITVSGSVNFTNKGYGENIENYSVLGNWFAPRAVNESINDFENIWNNNSGDTISLDYNSDIKDIIKKVIDNSGTYKKYFLPLLGNQINKITFEKLLASPFFVEWNVNGVNLMPHQKRVVKEALSRYPIRAILADEVGLGKTIEASYLIDFAIKNYNAKNIVLIVPASLKKQWQQELYTHFKIKSFIYESTTKLLKFQVDDCFEIVNLTTHDELWDFKKNIIIISSQFFRNFQFNSPRNQIDLVLLDEAHAARITNNSFGEREVTKLFDAVKSIFKCCHHKLLLTATPFQTSNLDYLGLLELISNRDLYDDAPLKRVAQLNKNIPLNRNDKIDSVKELLSIWGEDIFGEKLTLDSQPHILLPFYSEQFYIKHHLTTVYTLRNTRQSLISNGYVFPDVELHSSALEMGLEEIDCFDAILEFVNEGLFKIEKRVNNAAGFGYVKSIYAQRLVSSFEACKNTLNNRLAYLNGLLIDDTSNDEISNEDFEDGIVLPTLNIELTANLRSLIEDEISYIKTILNRIKFVFYDSKNEKDPKVKECYNLVEKHLVKNESILIFSRFTATTNKLVDFFVKNGIEVGQYQGDTKRVYSSDGTFASFSKSELSDKFKKREFKILICSDAASEGLNLQSANVLINVDVPWNPARLLQRFGRIDRFGQTSSRIYFYNLIYPNSIEDRMYNRLNGRNIEFRELLGTTPEIIDTNYSEFLQSLELEEQVQIQDEIRYKNSNVILSEVDLFDQAAYLKSLIIKLPDISWEGNSLIFENEKFEFSLRIHDENYLNIWHPIIQKIITRNLISLNFDILINKNGNVIFPYIKRQTECFLIISKEDLLEILILPQTLENNHKIIAFDPNNFNSEKLRVILSENNDLIDPSKLLLSDEICPLLEF